jgi:opacity protein-like surface antigen
MQDLTNHKTTVTAAVAVLCTALCAAVCTPAHAASGTQWYVHTGGLSHHFEQTRAADREWSETHPGLGFERRDVDADSPWQLRWTAGAMRDSRRFWSGYGGATYVYRWQWRGSIETSLGAGAFGFYRSVSWSGKRALVPALLPTASIAAADGTLGMNIVYIPRVSIGGGKATPPTVLGQMVFRFK